MSIAPKHSMDIPHVTAVELPLIVKDEARAIAMLGGAAKIGKVVGLQYGARAGAPAAAVDTKSAAAGAAAGTAAGIADGARTARPREAHAAVPAPAASTENVLELRLRSDPFHHPVQSLTNATEKILLKVSIPRAALPADYHQNPHRHRVRDLVRAAAGATVRPVAIVDYTLLFKAMADFQVSTRHNDTVQDFRRLVVDGSYGDLMGYFERHEGLQLMLDYQDPAQYCNTTHQLPPPPLFLPIQFPFDYRYQKNPLTATMRDAESGEVRVVAKRLTPRLHTIIVDFGQGEVPHQPALPLRANLAKLRETPPAVNTMEFALEACVRWLETMFELKPIWTRKHLEDVVPRDLKRVIKQALPYVSFIYKSGPWRFCNVKFGVNPKTDRRFWQYQSEYFRIPGMRFGRRGAGGRVVPPTLTPLEIAISSNLFFDGVTLPDTITYQVGDLLDADIQGLLAKAQRTMADQFLREKPDFQDGWLNKQTMECIRRIIRYKLLRLVRDEAIDPERIQKILEVDYSKGDDEDDDEAEEIVDEEIVDGGLGDDQGDDDDDDGEDDAADLQDFKEDAVDEATLVLKLQATDEGLARELSGLVGFIKQDLMV